MPLIKRKSQKAFEHNLKAEMHAGKPQDQSLAIAYSVKRKAKKASGGMVKSGSKDMDLARGGRVMKAEGGEISASNEKRPMPDNEYHDEIMDSHNRARKALKDSQWDDKPTERQAVMNNSRKVMPIKRPKMVPSDAFSTRLYDQEGRLEESAKPGPYGEQPPKDYDEKDARMEGHSVRDMEDEHSTHRKPYAKGGEVEESDYRHPMNKYEDDLLDLDPSHDEGRMMADSHDEEGQDRQGPAISDMEEAHSEHSEPYHDAERNEDDEMEMNPAHGKYSADDSEMQLEEEAEEEHHNSIAAAIMAKKKAKEAKMSDSDMDEMLRLYEGGEITRKSDKILSHDSIYSDDSSQADLSRNHDEDANEEDQLSFNALRKENYNDSNLDAVNHMDSAQHGDDEEMDSHDRHDMISQIRRKMKKQRQF